MELIAASRIVKAQERVKAAKPYANKMAEVIRNVGRASGGASHPLLEARPVEKVGVLVITSDRGLAGAYNSSIIRLAERRMIDLQGERKTIRLYAVGKKAQTYFTFRKYHIERSFLGVTDRPGYGDARAIANTLMDEYASGAVDAVEVFNTEYLSALIQAPAHATILPITPPSAKDGAEATGPAPAYSYEPEPGEILGRLLPRYVESEIFGRLLDSSASEHASRQRAMKAATENADELIKVLTRTANQARQAEITTEISEIVGGAEALAKG